MPGQNDYKKPPHIQIAIAAGLSILAIATSSVWFPMKPLDPLLLTIPALIEVGHGVVFKKCKDAWYAKTVYWVGAILVSTAFLILLRASR